MKEELKGVAHTLTLGDGKIVVTAVRSVPTFDAGEIDIVLEEDNLKILGSELNIARLDLESEIVEISGKVRSMTYGKDVKTSLMKRIFK